jgi:hypothetical protein
LLTGCDLSTHSEVDAALEAMLRFDDVMQAKFFGSTRLAETYPASAITTPFRFNAFYAEWQVPVVDSTAWRLGVSGADGVAANLTDHAAYLYRGLEPDWSVERRAARRIFTSRRRGFTRSLC